MSADESEDGSDIMEASEDNEDGEDTFMHRYSDALNEELKDTTLQKSFVRANDHSNKNEVIFSSFAGRNYPISCLCRWEMLPLIESSSF